MRQKLDICVEMGMDNIEPLDEAIDEFAAKHGGEVGDTGYGLGARDIVLLFPEILGDEAMRELRAIAERFGHVNEDDICWDEDGYDG